MKTPIYHDEHLGEMAFSLALMVAAGFVIQWWLFPGVALFVAALIILCSVVFDEWN